MAEPDHTNDTAARGRLPSPGCLFAVTLLVALASVCFWISWRVNRQKERIDYFAKLGVPVDREPGRPVWLHDLVVVTLGEEHAVGLSDITGIQLYGTNVTDSLQILSGLSSLQWLSLNQTQMSDAGLQHLSGLTNLERLNLNNTQITDAGLRHLSGLTNLEFLDLGNTQVTDAGVAELQSQLPGVEIVRRLR